MNVSEMIARFKSIAEYDLDPVGGLSDANIVTYLNQAMNDVSRRLRVIEYEMTIPMTAGKAVYPFSVMPRHVLRVLGVRFDGHRREFVDSETYTLENPNYYDIADGEPIMFLTESDALRIVPAPSASAAAKVLRVRAQVLPEQMSAGLLTAVCELPVHVHEPVVSYAVYESCSPNATEGQQMMRLDKLKQMATRRVTEEAARHMASNGPDINDAARSRRVRFM